MKSLNARRTKIGKVLTIIFLLTGLISLFSVFSGCQTEKTFKEDITTLVPVTYPDRPDVSYFQVTLYGDVEIQENVRFTKSSKKPTLVFVPGLGDAAVKLNFLPIIEGIKSSLDKFDILVIEPLGYGYSSDSIIERDVETICYEWAEILKALNSDGNNTFIPHSISGGYTIMFNNLYADMLNSDIGVIGLDTSVPSFSYVGTAEFYEEFFMDTDIVAEKIKNGEILISEMLGSSPEEMANKYADLFPNFEDQSKEYEMWEIWAEFFPREAEGFKYTDEQKSEFIQTSALKKGSMAMRTEVNAILPNMESMKGLTYTKPVLLLVNDRYGDDWINGHKVLLPEDGKSRMETLDADHYLWLEQLKTVNSEILSYFK